MVVDDGADVRAGLVDGAVDEALRIRLASGGLEGRAVERELHDVRRLDALGRAGAREAVAIDECGMPDADVAEGVDDPLAGEDPVGGDEFLERGRIHASIIVDSGLEYRSARLWSDHSGA